MWTDFLVWLETYAVPLGSAGAIVGIVTVAWSTIKRPFTKDKPVELGAKSLETLSQDKPVTPESMNVVSFIRIRKELKADLEDEFAQAHADEKAQLGLRIAEFERQIADPEPALADAEKRIAELETLLDRSGNDIGGDRIAAAKVAMEAGDYSLADDLFAEIEARRQLEVQEAARAAYGRGEVAEAEVRWADAATHYGRAARLDPTFEALRKSSEFAQRAGDYASAYRHSGDLVDLAWTEDDQEKLANAFNEHALNTTALGKFAEAEALYQQALTIGRATLGVDHPDYAKNLNNLAGLVFDLGRQDEAVALQEQAAAIALNALGAEHPNTKVMQDRLDHFRAAAD